ncbi:MAG: formyltransferase family protein [Alphaproteobacteria bacterium]
MTTDTAHHRYFLRQLSTRLPAGCDLVMAMFETRPYPWRRLARRHAIRTLPNLWRATAANPYLQPRSFAHRQNAFEYSRFFPNGDATLPAALPVEQVYSVNDETARRAIAKARPDVLYVYGTGKIVPKTFALPALGSINAHGGRLPGYRGLDTNLWAAYNGQPQEMSVTLHQMDEDLDTGPVYVDHAVAPHREMSIFSLRYFTTLVCLDLFLGLTKHLADGTLTPRSNDRAQSRYYGPMPWLLKRRTDTILRQWASTRAAA